jgi:SAM-dependent methyltransferase
MKILDLGCGKRKYPKSIGIDFSPNTDADIVHDLNKYPYPFNDNAFDMVHASHILEHLDDTVKTMNEIHRICKPNAKIIIRVPHFSQAGAWANPTHRRAFATYTFDYFEKNSSEKYSDKYFKVVKKRLNYLLEPNYHKTWKIIIWKIINYFANLNLWFCERVWCYWFGGFSEIYFELKVIK